VPAIPQYQPSASLDHAAYWQTLDRSRELLLGNRYRYYLQQIAPNGHPPDPLLLMPVVEELASFTTSPGHKQRPWYRQQLLDTLQRLAPYLVTDQPPAIALVQQQRAERQLHLILQAVWQRLLPIIENYAAAPGLITSQAPELPASPEALGQQLTTTCRQLLLAVPEERQALRIEASFYRRMLRYSGWSALLEKGAERAANLCSPDLGNQRWLPGIIASSYFYSSIAAGDIDQQSFSAELLAALEETVIQLADPSRDPQGDDQR
jgi:hypothetical protein